LAVLDLKQFETLPFGICLKDSLRLAKPTTGLRNYAIHTMTAGSTAIVRDLYRDGQLDGILSLDGGQGTIIGTTVMQALPFGVPKP
jgi:uncharacterized protein (UPF0261 family)